MDNAVSFTLRTAEPRDVEAIVGLITELASFENLGHLLQVTPDKLRPQLFGDPPAAEALVAESAGRVVAFALFFANFSTFLAQPGLYLEDLYVQPGHRGQGIGEALLTRLAQTAVDRAGLERERDPLLPADGRDRDDGVAHLPRDRRCTRGPGPALTAQAAQAAQTRASFISTSGATRTCSDCELTTPAMAYSRRAVSRGSGAARVSPLGVVSAATRGVVTVAPRLTTTAVSPDASLT